MKETNNFRVESDLIGSRELSNDVLYGVQTLRGIENFEISKFRLSEYPLFIHALAITKMAAARANHELGLISDTLFDAITQACNEILEGRDRKLAGPTAPAKGLTLMEIHFKGEKE